MFSPEKLQGATFSDTNKCVLSRPQQEQLCSWEQAENAADMMLSVFAKH